MTPAITPIDALAIALFVLGMLCLLAWLGGHA